MVFLQYFKDRIYSKGGIYCIELPAGGSLHPKNTPQPKAGRENAAVPFTLLFHNGQDRWTAARSLKEYQNSGDPFGDYILNLKYYLVDSELEEDYILVHQYDFGQYHVL